MSQKNLPDYFQQGDVILVPVEIKGRLPKIDGNVLQHGEATGHAHRFFSDDFSIVEDKKTQKRYLRVVEPGALRHEEHKEINLPSGDFEIRIVREYDHFKEESRRVVD